jgi:L-lysine exporter family protein LysE/ArgO
MAPDLSAAIPAAIPAALTGAALSASLIVAIGAQNTFVLRQGLRREHAALVVAICTVLDVALMAVGVSGLAAALGTRPLALALLAIGSAAFLAWYGFGAARRAWSPQALTAAVNGQPQSARRVAAQTLAITLLNPHVYLDTVLLVGAVGAQQAAEMRPAFVAGAGLASAAWFAALGFGARLLAPLFARPLAWRILDALVAVTMFALATALLRMAL